MLTIKDVQQIRRAAWCLEDKELVSEMLGAKRAWASYKAEGNIDQAEWYRLYYWAIRNELVTRWK